MFDALITVLGIGLVLIALRDIFHELFQPRGGGSISGFVTRAMWATVRSASRRSPRYLSLAGPLAVIAVLASWTAALAVGWALIYLPYMPEGLIYAPALDPSTQAGFLDALYLSLVVLATLGFGDITPQSDTLQLIMPIEAVLGFALLTAGISWVLSIYPVVGYRRDLAHELTLLREADERYDVRATDLDDEALERLLTSLIEKFMVVNSGFMRFRVTYYFRTDDTRTSLPANLPFLLHLLQTVERRTGSPAVRLRIAMIELAIRDLAQLLASEFLRMSPDDPRKVVAAYARDHLHDDAWALDELKDR